MKKSINTIDEKIVYIVFVLLKGLRLNLFQIYDCHNLHPHIHTHDTDKQLWVEIILEYNLYYIILCYVICVSMSSLITITATVDWLLSDNKKINNKKCDIAMKKSNLI